MKITLRRINYGTHKIGEQISSPEDLPEAEALTFVKNGWAYLDEADAKSEKSPKSSQEIYQDLLAEAEEKGFVKDLHEDRKTATLNQYLKNLQKDPKLNPEYRYNLELQAKDLKIEFKDLSLEDLEKAIEEADHGSQED